MKNKNILVCILLWTLLLSCKKYLSLKPDKAVAVPSTLRDMRVILNNQSNLNSRFAELGEIAAGDYYVTSADWSSLTNEEDKQNYYWHPQAEDISCWSNPYKTIFYANTVLDNIGYIERTEANKAEWNSCKGEALFFRAFAFFDLAQVYCAPFNPSDNNTGLGLPLKLSADLDEPVFRSTLQQTYDRIISDLNEAAALLPVSVPVKTRPSKPAAWAALARIYLAMEKYEKALICADSSLLLYDQLIDYNTVSAAAAIPFSLFNTEVIFHAYSPGSGLLNISRCKVDSLLYNSYSANDLRKTVFFKNNGNGTYGYKGSYNATTVNYFFNGLATDELYLVKAECLARTGNTPAAMNTLNLLLTKRWRSGTFLPFTASTAEQALRSILTERRKELLFRSLRWQDLRRLNRDPRFSTQLTRIINGQTYSLPPDDLRYIMLIPAEVIALNGIPQNPR